MKRSYYILLYLFFILNASISAQTFNFEGKVVDEDNRPMQDVSVTFLRINKSIDRFTFTDDKGRFVMAMEQEPAFISFTYLGYSSLVVPVSEYSKGKAFRMVPSDIKLKEVKIKSNRVSVKEDTITYEVSGFRMPQDRSIADVLKKMPGLEVLPGGTIRFEDKNISKLYIEGMDLMGDNYALATNNLSGKVVKKVEILRNHQQIAALRGKNFSEQSAINLVLEDEVKFAFSGTLDIGGGINGSKDGLWDIRALGMFLGKKHQNLSLYKSNNVGINTADELKPQINDAEMYLPESSPVLSLPNIDMNLIDEEHYLDNRDHLIATNHLIQFNKENSLRTQFSYLNSDQEQENEITTLYFYPDRTVTYNEINSTSLESENINGEITFERNSDRSFVKNIISGNWRENSSDQAFMMNDERMSQLMGVTHKYLSDRLQLVLPINDRHFFKLTSLNGIGEMPQQLTVAPGIFPDLLNGGEEYASFHQQVKLNTLYTKNSTDWQFKLFNFYLGTRLGIDYSREKITSAIYGSGTGDNFTSAADFGNNVAFSDMRVHATPDIRYQKNGFRMNLTVPVSYHVYQLENSFPENSRENLTRLFVEPGLNVNYEMNSLWSVIPSVVYRYQTPDIMQLYSNYIFTQYREASKGTGFYTFSNLIAAMTLKFNNPLNGMFWSITGNVVQGFHDKIAKARQEEMLHATEMIDYKHNTFQWNVRTRLSKTFSFWKTFVGITAQYMENKSKLMLEEDIVPYQTNSVVVTGNYALQPNRYISIEGSERFGHTTLSSGIMSDSYAYNLVNKLDINIFPASLWKFKWSNAWYINYKPVHSSIYFMNFSLAYTPKKYSIELLVNNALDRQMYLQNTLTSLSERIVNQSFRPREYLVKISYMF